RGASGKIPARAGGAVPNPRESAGDCSECFSHGHSSPSAFERNVAICPRVRGASGQKFPLPQPPVTPVEASASTNWKNGGGVGTSANVAVTGAGATSRVQLTCTFWSWIASPLQYEPGFRSNRTV